MSGSHVVWMAYLAAVGLGGGCFAELSGGYYPTTTQRFTAPTGEVTSGDPAAWSASIKVGFYIDVPLEPIQSGVAVAWSPNGWGTDLINSDKQPADAAGDGTMLRTDFVIPWTPFSALPRIRPRLVAEYGWYTDGGLRQAGMDNFAERDPASGHRFFIGPALGFSTVGGSVIAAGGLQRMVIDIPVDLGRPDIDEPAPGFSSSAWGVGGSITLTLTPSSSYGNVAFASSSVISSGTAPAAGCYYRTTCDVDGNCRSEYYCP